MVRYIQEVSQVGCDKWMATCILIPMSQGVPNETAASDSPSQPISTITGLVALTKLTMKLVHSVTLSLLVYCKSWLAREYTVLTLTLENLWHPLNMIGQRHPICRWIIVWCQISDLKRHSWREPTSYLFPVIQLITLTETSKCTLRHSNCRPTSPKDDRLVKNTLNLNTPPISCCIFLWHMSLFACIASSIKRGLYTPP
jgi:hypothetical protein